MKKLNFLLIALAMLISMPAMAQTRKEKKAAKKAQWEMEQEFKRKEAELIYQMRLDSIKAAQEERDAAKAAAKRKEEEQARREAEEEQYRKQTAVRTLPCQIYDDADWFVASGSVKFLPKNQKLTPSSLLRSLKRQLFDKLRGKYQQVTQDYFDQMDDSDAGSYAREHIESAGRQIIEQMVNEVNENCREVTTYPDSEGMYTMYMSIRISKKQIIEEVAEGLSEDRELKTRFNEKQFRDSAFKVFEEDNAQKFDEFKEQ